MTMGTTLIVLVLLAAVPGSESMQWAGNPADGAVLYACAHSTISLPFTLLLSAGDVIEDIKWFFSGRSQEMIAMEAAGNFIPLPAFSGRVTKTTNAGINVDHVQVLDSGNFSVEVLARTAAGDLVTLWRSAYVHVTNDLQTSDGDLHVDQKPVAEYNNQTGQFHLVLTCGVFTYPTSPAFDATWQTPSQHSLASSGYHDDRFFLLVPNPVEGGSYSCHVPSAQACIHGNSSAKASITVDKLEARLVVMEATLGAKDAALEGALQAKVTELQAKDNELQGKDTALQAKVTELQAKDNELQAKDTALQAKVTELEVKNAALEVKNNALETSVGVLKQSVSFHAREMSDHTDLPVGSALQFTTVVSNIGNGYNPSTGHFTAPFNATYFFIANTEDWHTDRYTQITLMVDNTQIHEGYSKTTPDFIPVIVYGTVRLTQGQTVWVKIVGSNSSFLGGYTAFSGFLVSHTP